MSLPNTETKGETKAETKAERVERIKKEKNPLTVLDDVRRLIKNGEPLDDETIERLKWYGIYPQKQQKDETEKYYMLRVKLVGGCVVNGHCQRMVSVWFSIGSGQYFCFIFAHICSMFCLLSYL